ncbi:MAG: SPASM domain-containing protein [Bacteroidia bacterium]|nr:SPASM domain-containing protein [Bacteroidia bacterium]
MTLMSPDIKNFLSTLTVKRSVNAIKVLSSYYLSRITGKTIHWGYPISISFEPTTACNLRCPECPSGLRSFTRQTGNLKKDFFSTTIDQIADKLIYLNFYFQGEPYINPDFLEMVSYANQKGLYTICSTNAHFLDDKNCIRTIESGLSRLVISVDGTTQASYSNYRKQGSLQTVLDGTRNLIKWKDKMNADGPYIIFQFLVVRQNEHQVEEIKQIAEEIGVDEVKLKSAQIYDYKNGNPLIPENDKYSRYKKLADGSYTIKNKLSNHCWKLWHGSVFTWNGLLVPCCFDKDAQYIMGDLNKNSFENVWNSKTMEEFRGKLMTGRQNIDICNNCTEGCKVFM